MRLMQSHGRLLSIFALVIAPSLFGLGEGIWLHSQLGQGDALESPDRRLGQIYNQGQLLTDSLQEEVNAIGAEARELQWLTRSHSDLQRVMSRSPIMLWAELGLDHPVIRGVVRTVQNPVWKRSLESEKFYLTTVVQSLHSSEIQSQGVQVVRVKQDFQGSRELLGLAYPGEHESILLVLVDPVLAFPSIQRWSSHGQGGKSRSYLLGADGLVLAHSQKKMNSIYLNDLPLFKNQILNLFNGSLRSGQGDFTSIDHLSVGAAYFRLGTLPVAVVVEEVNPVQSHSGYGLLLFSGIALFGVALASAVLLKTYLVKTVTLTLREPMDEMDDFSETSETSETELSIFNDIHPNQSIHPIQMSNND